MPLTISSWTRVCFANLPCYDHSVAMRDDYLLINNRYALKTPPHKHFLLFDEIEQRINKLAEVMNQQLLAPGVWFDDGDDSVRGAVSSSGLTDVEGHTAPVAFPFVQKLLLPSDAVVALFGDLHGSLHSILRELNSLVEQGYLEDDFTVTAAWRGRFFVVFLGDYVDRGAFGTCLWLRPLLLVCQCTLCRSRCACTHSAEGGLIRYRPRGSTCLCCHP